MDIQIELISYTCLTLKLFSEVDIILMKSIILFIVYCLYCKYIFWFDFLQGVFARYERVWLVVILQPSWMPKSSRFEYYEQKENSWIFLLAAGRDRIS